MKGLLILWPTLRCYMLRGHFFPKPLRSILTHFRSFLTALYKALIRRNQRNPFHLREGEVARIILKIDYKPHNISVSVDKNERHLLGQFGDRRTLRSP